MLLNGCKLRSVAKHRNLEKFSSTTLPSLLKYTNINHVNNLENSIVYIDQQQPGSVSVDLQSPEAAAIVNCKRTPSFGTCGKPRWEVGIG